MAISMNTRILSARYTWARKSFEALRSYGSFTLSRNYTIAELAALAVLKARRAPTHLSISFPFSFFSLPSFFISFSVMSDSYPPPTRHSASPLGFLYELCLPSFQHNALTCVYDHWTCYERHYGRWNSRLEMRIISRTSVNSRYPLIAFAISLNVPISLLWLSL